MKYIIAALTFVVLFTACKKSSDPTPEQPIDNSTSVAQTFLNVSYGSSSQQNMDVYLPANRSVNSTPSFIFIHGGSYVFGDKVDINPVVDSFKRRFPNYAIFNINYRLVNSTTFPVQNTFPTQENDIKAATDFILGKLSAYGIANKFVMMGFSSGGHLALLQGYKYSNISTKAVVDYYGPTDFVDIYNNPPGSASTFNNTRINLTALLNGTPTTNAALYGSSSPINYVTSTTAPTILFHGNLDTIVKVNQTTMLRDKLNLNNRPQVTQLYPNEGHVWITPALLKQDFDKIQTFVAQHVQ
jgi:acetyl esterase/lipase